MSIEFRGLSRGFVHILPVLPEGRLEQNFTVVKPMYTASEAAMEANRCLYCADAPCIKACPTGIDVPTFIHKTRTGNIIGAARTILKANILGMSCARVCPVEVLCVGACVYNAWGGGPPIAIGRLQLYATQTVVKATSLASLLPVKKAVTRKRVALLGAGPASIAAAGMLALEGHSADIFEKKQLAGGLNTLGVAPYKQNIQQALEEIRWICELGNVTLHSGIEVVAGEAGIGQVSASTLLGEYDALFLGLGLEYTASLDVPHHQGPGVYGAVSFIERIKVDPHCNLNNVQRALAIGGGSTAIDVAHELKLLGVPDVAILYRRGEQAMPGYTHELAEARKHGVRLIENRVVTAFQRDAEGMLSGVTLARSENGQAIGSEEEVLTCQLVMLATGHRGVAQIAQAFPGIEVDDEGLVQVNPLTYRTGNPKVWSAGDCVNGGQLVVNAAQEAKLAVYDMLRVFGGHG